MAYELDICSCLEASSKRVAGSISDYQVYSFPEKCVHLYPDSRSALTPRDSLAVSGLVTTAAATPSTPLQWSASDAG